MSGGPFDIFGLGADPEKPEEAPARKAQLASARPLPKRFYESVEIVDGDTCSLTLDGRPVKTPGRRLITVPTEAIAARLRDEWLAQKDVIDPKDMPLTRLVNSAIDGVADQMESVRAEAVKFAGTDLLCYRAEEPQRLVERQAEKWDPVLNWASDRFSCQFELAGGVLFVKQPEATFSSMEDAANRFTQPLHLAAVHSMTTLLGSFLLTLAVTDGFLTPDEAWDAAHLDEDWNIEQWGFDEEAARRRAYRKMDMDAASLIVAGIFADA